MIISHQHRYVFVEMPHTGSTAMSSELRENYAGEKILSKHSPYHSFLRVANQEEKTYFAFAAIRNPLDVAVTKYIRYATNHRNRYTDPVKIARNRGLGNWFNRRIYKRVVDENLDFSAFFSIYYRFPFNTWASLHHKNLDFVMRFENLQEDFSRVLSMIGLEQVRPLPIVNSSSGKRRDFTSYYGPNDIKRAKKVFAGYMDEWGYDFPEEWGSVTRSSLDEFKYNITSAALKFYWRHLKQLLWL